MLYNWIVIQIDIKSEGLNILEASEHGAKRICGASAQGEGQSTLGLDKYQYDNHKYYNNEIMIVAHFS